jgi:hypothetical protein
MRPANITKKQWARYNLLFILSHFLGEKNSAKYLGPRKKRLFEEILKNEGMENRGKVFYNKDIECTDIDGYLSKRDKLMEGPLLFKGVAKDWECVQNWDKEYFRTYFADVPVSLVGSVGLVEKKNQNKFVNTSLSKYLDESEKDKENYLRFSRIVDEIPDLRKAIDTKFLERFKSKTSKGGYLYMFMGEKDSKTTMHAAIIQSLFLQVKGKKKWTIYPANERIFVDAVAGRRPYYYTDADPNHPEDPAFPLLKHAIRYEIMLEDGDVLWFPSFYWHYVENPTANIGVTYKFTDFAESLKISKVLTSLLFLTTKPTIIEIFFYNLFKKRDLHFDKNI